MATDWICCQIGAREHYSIPRALHASARLQALITDLWLPPNHPLLFVLGPRASGRFHPDLATARVFAGNSRMITGSLKNYLARHRGWPTVIYNNADFQGTALRWLSNIHQQNPSRRGILFSYSYAAKTLFEYAKSIGWSTVLGQIDPGPVEESIVARLHQNVAEGCSLFSPAPATYWSDWKAECQLSDSILVNSEWSRQALLDAGIPREKVAVLPLVFQPDPATFTFERQYPTAFTRSRPLRLLFLGQVGLRKGIHLLILAADQLKGAPVEIHVVGPLQVSLPSHFANHPILRWHGSVPRCATATHYRDADAFLFPTFSDGFGLTQLEAQSWKLPLLVSHFCGRVVEHEINGLVIDPLTADTIADAIRIVLRDPGRLAAMSRLSTLRPEHRIEGLTERLITAVDFRH